MLKSYLWHEGLSQHAKDPLYFTKRAKEIWYFSGSMTADQSDLDFINIAEFFVNNQKQLDLFRSALHEQESSDPEELRESFDNPHQK